MMFKWKDTTHFDEQEEKKKYVPMKSLKMKCMKLMLMDGIKGDDYHLFIIKIVYNYSLFIRA